jgi:hypothetical protein
MTSARGTPYIVLIPRSAYTRLYYQLQFCHTSLSTFIQTMASNSLTTEEIERASQLLSAQDKAVLLFEEIERDLVRHGVTERN